MLILFIIPSKISSQCIDSSKIGIYNNIEIDTIKVCGCNEITYDNSYQALNSGVTSFKYGTCTNNESLSGVVSYPIVLEEQIPANYSISLSHKILSFNLNIVDDVCVEKFLKWRISNDTVYLSKFSSNTNCNNVTNFMFSFSIENLKFSSYTIFSTDFDLDTIIYKTDDNDSLLIDSIYNNDFIQVENFSCDYINKTLHIKCSTLSNCSKGYIFTYSILNDTIFTSFIKNENECSENQLYNDKFNLILKNLPKNTYFIKGYIDTIVQNRKIDNNFVYARYVKKISDGSGIEIAFERKIENLDINNFSLFADVVYTSLKSSKKLVVKSIYVKEDDSSVLVAKFRNLISLSDCVKVEAYSKGIEFENYGILKSNSVLEVDNISTSGDLNEVATINLKPNPAITKIEVSSHIIIKEYFIYNTNGDLIEKGILNAKCLMLDVADYNSGIYFLKINDSNNSLTIIRFIKK